MPNLKDRLNKLENARMASRGGPRSIFDFTDAMLEAILLSGGIDPANHQALKAVAGHRRA